MDKLKIRTFGVFLPQFAKLNDSSNQNKHVNIHTKLQFSIVKKDFIIYCEG